MFQKRYNVICKERALAGFTLVELLVTIAIISLLSSIVFASLNSARAKARDARRIADFKQIQLAMELFYDQTGQYPQSAGHATWSGHWENFAQCLEQGTGCGFTVSNYVSPISNVPQDPQRSTADPFADDVTYIPGHPTGCTDGQSYRILVQLETDHAALDTDFDDSGGWNMRDGCADANRYYCVGVGTCS